MTDDLYTKGKQAVIVDGTIKVALVDGADYTPDLSADNFLDNVPRSRRRGPVQAMEIDNRTYSIRVTDERSM